MHCISAQGSPFSLLGARILLCILTSLFDPSGGLCREAVEAEYNKNKELGERIGCWKGGVLVEDDDGSVRKALQDLEQQ